MPPSLLRFVLAAVLLALSAPVQAQPAALDPTFGDGGLVSAAFVPTTWDGATAVVELPDGGLLIAGYVGYVSGAFVEDYGIVRLRPDGTLDTAFGTDGIVTTDFGGNDSPNGRIAVTPDGGFFVSGWGQFPDGNSDFLLARYTTGGALDLAFGTGGLVRTDLGGFDGASAIALQDDGKVLVVGYGAGTALDVALVRYLADGTLDASFGTGGIVRTDVAGANDSGNAVALLADGRILVAGQAVVAGSTDIALLRYTASGALDPTFGTGGVTTLNLNRADIASDLVVRPDGRIVIGGYTNVGSLGGSPPAFDVAVVGFTANGALDPSFGTGGVVTTDVGGTDNRGGRLALLADGRLLVLTDEVVAGQGDLALLRYTSSGALDTSFGTGGVARVPVSPFNEIGAALIRTAGGEFVVTGVANGSAESTDRDVFAARLTAEGGFVASFGSGGVATVDAAPALARTSYFTAYDVAAEFGGGVVVAGHSGGDRGEQFAVIRLRPDGSPDPAFGTDGRVTTAFGGDYSRAYAVAVQPDGKVVAAGIGGAERDVALVRYALDGTLDASFGTGGRVTTDFGGTEVAQAIVLLPDGDILVAGRAGAGGDFGLARYDSNGTLDASFGTGGRVLTDFGWGDSAYSLLVQTDGRILAAGVTTGGGTPAFALARYLPGGTLDTSFGTGGLVTTSILDGAAAARKATVLSDGRIVVAGFAQDDAGVRFARVVYTAAGALDAAAPGGAIATAPFGDPVDAITDVAFLGDGRIVAGGYINPNDVSDLAVARYLADGTPDPSFGTDGRVTTDLGNGSQDAVNAIAIQADGKVVAVGYGPAGAASGFAVARYGAPASSYAVTVRAVAGVDPVAGATVTLAGPAGPATATTDADGRARFTAAAGADYTVAIAAADAAFLPSSFTLDALAADQAITFVRTEATGSAQVTVSQQTTVTASGGTVSLPGGGDLAIPPGALSGTLPLVVGTFDSLPPGAPSFAGPLFYFGPPGTQFGAPVTLTVPYDEADIPAGTLEEDLQMVRFDETTGTYAAVVPSTVDPVANTITAQITGFSGYGAAAPLGTAVAGAPGALGLVAGPNPVAGRLTVQFTLPSAAATRLVLVDMLGREVARPVDRALGAGPHAVSVDAARLAPGAYVLRLTAGDVWSAQRLTVVR